MPKRPPTHATTSPRRPNPPTAADSTPTTRARRSPGPAQAAALLRPHLKAASSALARAYRRRPTLRMDYARLPDAILATGLAAAVTLAVAIPIAQAAQAAPTATQTPYAAPPTGAPESSPAPTPSGQPSTPAPDSTTQPQDRPSVPATAPSPHHPDDLGSWIQQAQDILTANGDRVPSAKAMKATALAESSGNPKAVNRWDSNARAGTPSIGLTQMIKPTFKTYALPGHTDITNPVDNLVASARYCNHRYGGMDNVARTRCYGSCWRGY